MALSATTKMKTSGDWETDQSSSDIFTPNRKELGTRGTFPAGNQGYQDKTACVLGRKNNSRNHHHLKWIWTTQISIVAESFRISTSGPDSEVL